MAGVRGAVGDLGRELRPDQGGGGGGGAPGLGGGLALPARRGRAVGDPRRPPRGRPARPRGLGSQRRRRRPAERGAVRPLLLRGDPGQLGAGRRAERGHPAVHPALRARRGARGAPARPAPARRTRPRFRRGAHRAGCVARLRRCLCRRLRRGTGRGGGTVRRRRGRGGRRTGLPGRDLLLRRRIRLSAPSPRDPSAVGDRPVRRPDHLRRRPARRGRPAGGGRPALARGRGRGRPAGARRARHRRRLHPQPRPGPHRRDGRGRRRHLRDPALVDGARCTAPRRTGRLEHPGRRPRGDRRRRAHPAAVRRRRGRGGRGGRRGRGRGPALLRGRRARQPVG